MTDDHGTLAALVARYAAAQTLQQLAACARDYEAAGAPHLPSWPKLRLALTGNYSTQFLARGFPLALAARHLAAEVYESPYNQWRAELLEPGSALHAFAPTHVCLALTSIEFAYGSLRTPEAVVASVAAAVQAALKAGDAHFLVTLPEPLADELERQQRRLCVAAGGVRRTARGARAAAGDADRYRTAYASSRRCGMV